MKTGTHPGESRERVYRAILDSYAATGLPPTIRELGDLVGLKSTATVHWHLQTLATEGRIVLGERGSNRSITLPPGEHGTCRACGGTGLTRAAVEESTR